MENLFGFNYSRQPIVNPVTLEPCKGVYTIHGDGGKFITQCTNKFNLVDTLSMSNLAHSLCEVGYKNVSTYTHNAGRTLGINVKLTDKPSKVGESEYRMFLDVPNDGTGKGKLYLHQKRLICSNGLTRSLKTNLVTIPHTRDYQTYLDIAEQIMTQQKQLITETIQVEETLNKDQLDKYDILKRLNEWFYNHELPTSQKINELETLEGFRKAIFEMVDFKSLDRYNQLLQALEREKEYNQRLGLNLSRYTVLATVTNYLSRRTELSKSSASMETRNIRTIKKIESLLTV